MPIAAIGAIIGAVATIGGTVMQLVNASAARSAQQKQLQAQSEMANNQAEREKIQQIRQTRIAQAAVSQAAENQGVSTSSNAQGGQGSIISQGAANLSFLDQQQYLGQQAGRYAGQANAAEGQAQLWGGVASIGSSIFEAAGGTGGLKKIKF